MPGARRRRGPRTGRRCSTAVRARPPRRGSAACAPDRGRPKWGFPTRHRTDSTRAAWRRAAADRCRSARRRHRSGRRTDVERQPCGGRRGHPGAFRSTRRRRRPGRVWRRRPPAPGRQTAARGRTDDRPGRGSAAAARRLPSCPDAAGPGWPVPCARASAGSALDRGGGGRQIEAAVGHPARELLRLVDAPSPGAAPASPRGERRVRRRAARRSPRVERWRRLASWLRPQKRDRGVAGLCRASTGPGRRLRD